MTHTSGGIIDLCCNFQATQLMLCAASAVLFQGGPSTLDNCQLLQSTANRAKGNRTDMSRAELMQRSAFCSLTRELTSGWYAGLQQIQAAGWPLVSALYAADKLRHNAIVVLATLCLRAYLCPCAACRSRHGRCGACGIRQCDFHSNPRRRRLSNSMRQQAALELSSDVWSRECQS